MAGTYAFSTYVENAIINALLRNTAFPSPPANVYVALFTAAPSAGGGGTEVTGGSYARVAISTTGGFSAPTGDPAVTSNVADVVFPTATANWGTVGWLGIFDAATVGNLLFWGAVQVTKAVNNGDQVKFLASQLAITVD